MITVELSEDLILSTGNDADLGAMVRTLYYAKKEPSVKMIDPPAGWRYGFPKPIPEEVTDTTQWLLNNGYPQEEIDRYAEHFFCRYWFEPVKLSS